MKYKDSKKLEHVRSFLQNGKGYVALNILDGVITCSLPSKPCAQCAFKVVCQEVGAKIDYFPVGLSQDDG